MIYIKDVPSDIKNIEELLLFGFTNKCVFKKTYNEKECITQQCREAYRSFEDLLKICITYFPETTETELAEVLFKLNKSGFLYCIFCHDIEKLVFYKVNGYSEEFCNNFKCEDADGEFYYDDDFFENGKGKYSMKQIYNLANKNY